MNTTSQPKFVTVNTKNAHIISERIKQEKGYIFIVGPGHQSFGNDIVDVRFGLYFCPSIHNNNSLSVDLDIERERHREYLLRRIPRPTGDAMHDCIRGWFESLKLNPYEFTIDYQHAVGRGLFDKKGTTLFVPENQPLETPFEYALRYMLPSITHRFSDEEIKKIVAYAMEDLKTGSVMRKNTQAGIDADTALEI